MAVKERQDTCEDIQNIARKPKTSASKEELEEKAVWNYELFQGNLLWHYIRNKMSFLNCHLFIVSSIHVFIQQTFTRYPLHARQTGSIRRISSKQQNISPQLLLMYLPHKPSFRSLYNGFSCFNTSLSLNVSSSRRSGSICTLTLLWTRVGCLLCTAIVSAFQCSAHSPLSCLP